MMSIMRFRLTRHHASLAALAIVLVGAALLLQDVFGAVVVHLAAYGETRPVFGPLLFIVLAAFSVMLGPFTSAPLMPFAVGIWGPTITLLLLFAGWILGNAAAYGIGFHFGYPLVRKFVRKDKLDHWIGYLGGKISLWMIFLLRLAAPAEIGYAFGILKYDFIKYMVVVLAAEVPFAIILVYGGDAFVERRWPELIVLVAVAAIIMTLAFHAFERARKRR